MGEIGAFYAKKKVSLWSLMSNHKRLLSVEQSHFISVLSKCAHGNDTFELEIHFM